MKTWTVQEMIAERPCKEYTEARLLELWAGRGALAVNDILNLDIPAADKVWVLCRPDVMTPEQRARWLGTIVERAIRRVLGKSNVPKWERWAERWLSGEDRTRKSAEAAAEAATRAAWAEAWAAEASAWAAVEEAWAEAAAVEEGSAARAAEAAEYEKQINDCLEILKGD